MKIKMAQADPIDSAGNLFTISTSLPEWATVPISERQSLGFSSILLLKTFFLVARHLG
jgi:hypothetical protein